MEARIRKEIKIDNHDLVSSTGYFNHLADHVSNNTIYSIETI